MIAFSLSKNFHALGHRGFVLLSPVGKHVYYGPYLDISGRCSAVSFPDIGEPLLQASNLDQLFPRHRGSIKLQGSCSL